jgi:hypothetical protein
MYDIYFEEINESGQQETTVLKFKTIDLSLVQLSLFVAFYSHIFLYAMIKVFSVLRMSEGKALVTGQCLKEECQYSDMTNRCPLKYSTVLAASSLFLATFCWKLSNSPAFVAESEWTASSVFPVQSHITPWQPFLINQYI